jgi:hypothetical protein
LLAVDENGLPCDPNHPFNRGVGREQRGSIRLGPWPLVQTQLSGFSSGCGEFRCKLFEVSQCSATVTGGELWVRGDGVQGVRIASLTKTGGQVQRLAPPRSILSLGRRLIGTWCLTMGDIGPMSLTLCDGIVGSQFGTSCMRGGRSAASMASVWVAGGVSRRRRSSIRP